MKTSFNILLAAVLSAAFAAGQDPEAGTAEAPRSGPIKATLEPVQEVVTVPSADAPAEGSGSEARFEFVLTVEVTQATELPLMVLAGHDLRTTVDGDASIALTEVVEGKVPVAAGTKIVRNLSFDVAAWRAEDLARHTTVAFAWPGLEGAEATVRVVPDQSHIDLDALDLTKTKVKLITSRGDMVVGFRPDKAPKHVRNFIKLAKDGFYHGTYFHRVIENFMIQGGDPNTKKGATGAPGTGGPGWSVEAEFSDIPHERGVLSMARSQDPNSAGSQFFVMHGKAPQLDGKYSVFGQLEEGFETLDAIATSPVRYSPRGELSVPAEPTWLYAAVVLPVYKEN